MVKLLTNLEYNTKWTPKKQLKIEKYPDLDRKLKQLQNVIIDVIPAVKG